MASALPIYTGVLVDTNKFFSIAKDAQFYAKIFDYVSTRAAKIENHNAMAAIRGFNIRNLLFYYIF